VWDVMAFLKREEVDEWLSSSNSWSGSGSCGPAYKATVAPYFDWRCIERSRKRRELNVMIKVQVRSRIRNEK
jgi:hypothetical protein